MPELSSDALKLEDRRDRATDTLRTLVRLLARGAARQNSASVSAQVHMTRAATEPCDRSRRGAHAGQHRLAGGTNVIA